MTGVGEIRRTASRFVLKTLNNKKSGGSLLLRAPAFLITGFASNLYFGSGFLLLGFTFSGFLTVGFIFTFSLVFRVPFATAIAVADRQATKIFFAKKFRSIAYFLNPAVSKNSRNTYFDNNIIKA